MKSDGMQISVVIPLYNKRNGIERALQSVFAQTFQPFEIIIVNDGSTDGSEQVVAQINHPLVRLIHQPNAGVSAARNKGIETAQGDWIAFLDADDEWKPEFLATMKMLSFRYPDCKVLASAYELQDHKGNRKQIVLRKISFEGESGRLGNYFGVACCSHPPISSIAVMVSIEAIRNIGCFPIGVKAGEDLLTWARLAVSNRIAYSVKPLSVFIQDAAHTYEDKPNRVPDPDDFVGKELRKLMDTVRRRTENGEWRTEYGERRAETGNRRMEQVKDLKNYISHWYKMRASIYLRLGSFLPALKQCVKALKYNPTNKTVYIYLGVVFLPLSIRNWVFRRFGA